MKLPVLITLLSLFLLFSCEKDYSPTGTETGSPGRFYYQSYDTLGNLLVTGWLLLNFTDSTKIAGPWQLRNVSGRTDIGPQAGEGNLIGSIIHSSISIQLNPQVRDNNLGLVGTIHENIIEGKWFWTSYAGLTNWGTFTALKN